MGFFSFSSPQAPSLFSFLPAHLLRLFAPSVKSLEHEISFDLKTSYSTCTPPSFHHASYPSTSGAPVAQLPLEIVLSIIEAAYYSDNLEPNEALLKDCALVCRAWSMPIQKLLFTRVTLRTEAAYDSFCSAVHPSTERGCEFRDAVVRMRVILDHNQPFGLRPHSFAHAVTLCPNLYELNISLYGCAAPGEDIIGTPAALRMQRPAPSFEERSIALLKSGPMITALQFSNWSENHHSINQLLDVWPTLRSLVISGTPPQLPSDSLPPFPCALDELRMNFQTPPSIDFIKWLLHNSTDTLRTLELEREPSLNFLDYLVTTHGETLHSLALPACGSHEHALAIKKCRNLKEFRVENPWTSPRVYRKVSGRLEHIALGLDRDTPLQSTIQAVKSNVSLKAVTVHMWDGAHQHPQLSSLKIVCAYRGIALRMTSDIKTFRCLVRGHFVFSQAFPRIKSLANTNAMRS